MLKINLCVVQILLTEKIQGIRASDTPKYDLGLTSLANKCDKLKKAKMAKF